MVNVRGSPLPGGVPVQERLAGGGVDDAAGPHGAEVVKVAGRVEAEEELGHEVALRLVLNLRSDIGTLISYLKSFCYFKNDEIIISFLDRSEGVWP